MEKLIRTQDVEQWRQDGFLKLTNFLDSEEVKDLNSWAEEIDSWAASDDKWMHHYEQTEHGVRLARTEYVVAFHHGICQLLNQGRVPDAVGQLLGEPAVLFKEKFNYKYPGGGGYSPHQDAAAYDYASKHVTCAIAIDEATEENGCLYFAAGLHQQELLPMNDVGCIESGLASELVWEPILMQPGDAVFFSSYAPHKSSPNQSSYPRRNLYLTYNALSEGDFREVYYANKRKALNQAAQATAASRVAVSKIGHFNGKPVLNQSPKSAN